MKSMLENGGTLRPNARTLWEIQEKALHPPAETAGNLYAEICARSWEALARGAERRAAVRDEETLKAYQRETRRLFFRCIGGLPPACTAPARVAEKQTYGFFTLEKVLLEPRAGSFATAAVYAPLGEKGPRPAVLLLIGHTDAGKADPEYQYVAQLLAFAGFVVLALDPFGEGERFEHYESGIDLQPIQGCSGEHDLMDWKCKLLGVSLARYFIGDALAALDYLCARPDVDEKRIGLTGHSGGGTQVCMMMLAAGERFACAAPCTYVTDTRAMLEGGVDPDNEMIWPGSIGKGIDYVDLLAGIAPKPLMILAAENDFFPLEGTKRTLREARALWQAAGGIPPEMTAAPHAHAYSPALAMAAARFFLRHLSRENPDLASFAFAALPPEALRCTPDGMLLKAFPRMRTLQDELNGLLAEIAPKRENSPEAWLGEAVGTADSGPPRVYGEGICGHYAWRAVLWRVNGRHWNNGVFLRDMRQGDKKLPTVIALWPEGLARLAEHSAWIYGACQKGWQVLVMDAAAEGSLLPGPLGSSSLYIGWGTMYKLSAYLIQLGDSLCALRVRDVLAAWEMARRWPEAENVCLYARGEMSRYAELASLLRGIPCHTDGACQPYEEIVSEKYHDQTHTPAWIFPGILRHTDTRAVRERLSLRGLNMGDMAETPAFPRAYEGGKTV
ncbi:MAG: prolyl oligopeptidase family serine peptidase [Clostridia bacterium]|nr:prolyl oligopeptidase family serine peptidase [Clostridia bacterium]